eukprot:84519_1
MDDQEYYAYMTFVGLFLVYCCPIILCIGCCAWILRAGDPPEPQANTAVLQNPRGIEFVAQPQQTGNNAHVPMTFVQPTAVLTQQQFMKPATNTMVQPKTTIYLQG